MANEVTGEGPDDTVNDNSVGGAARLIEELLKRPEEEPEAPQGMRTPEGREAFAPGASHQDSYAPQGGEGEGNAPDAAFSFQAPREAMAEDNPNGETFNPHLVRVAQGMLAAFPDVKTEADLLRLGAENPDRYNRYLLMRDQGMRAAAEQASVETRHLSRSREKDASALGEALPDLKDPAKAPALIANLRAFAKRAGYSAPELAKASAKDWTLLHKAMQFEQGSADAGRRLEQARQRGTPASVQRPGAGRENARDETVRTDFHRLRKTGNVRDAASVIRHIMD